MTIFRAFLLSIAAGMAAVLGYNVLTATPPARARETPASLTPASHSLLGGIHVSEQIALPDLSRLKVKGYKTVIDLRPDGEVAGQPSSAEVGAEAERLSLAFAYVPTPHGDIPDGVATELSRVLATAEKPVMLYCRSGKRAARVWALAEAARSGGPDAVAISNAVRSAGQPVDDILPRITTRIAQRKPAS